MAQATGLVMETPSQEMPFKAVVSTDGEVVQERFFPSRPEAEAYLVETLKGLQQAAGKGGPDASKQ